MSKFVVSIAVLQATVIALFGALALSGDELGIARALTILVSLPFAALTVPALVLLRLNRVRAAANLAGLSAPATWLLWWLA